MEPLREKAAIENIIKSLPTFGDSSEEQGASMILNSDKNIALIKYQSYLFTTPESKEEKARSIYGVFFKECFNSYNSPDWEHAFTECGLEACFAIYSGGRVFCITQTINEAIEIFNSLKQIDIKNKSLIKEN